MVTPLTADDMVDALAKRAKVSDLHVLRVLQAQAELIYREREKGVSIVGFGGVRLARDTQPVTSGGAEPFRFRKKMIMAPRFSKLAKSLVDVAGKCPPNVCDTELTFDEDTDSKLLFGPKSSRPPEPYCGITVKQGVAFFIEASALNPTEVKRVLQAQSDIIYKRASRGVPIVGLGIIYRSTFEKHLKRG